MFQELIAAVDEETLDKIIQIFNLPRGWGTTYQDGPAKGKWYRRKRDGYHDLLRGDAFKKLIQKWPIVFSVSNHDGTSFNNFQSFAVYDFDNSTNPDHAKEPLEIIARQHDNRGINYLSADSGGKGYHLEVFSTAPIHTKEMEQFQNVILTSCAQQNREVDGKTIGFVKFSDGEWGYFNESNPYDPTLLATKQPHTAIEFLTAVGDGNMLKSPFSQHPKYSDKMELPMTVAQIMKHDRSAPQTKADVEHACNLVKRLKRTPYERILEIANVTNPQSPGAINIRTPKIHKHVRFSVPKPSPELDAKCIAIFEHILNTPCLQRCYESSVSINGTYYLRANLVTALATIGYTREEIAYFFYYNINDDADNANKGLLEYQVDYWYNRKYSCRCEYWQEMDSNKFCCYEPCGRRNPAQIEPEPNHTHLTRVKEFESIYQTCRDIILSGKKKVLAPKTTRAGFTTAMTISATELGLKILFLVPRTSIAEETFGDTICLAEEKRGVIIRGFVISANHKYCLKRLQEKTEWEEEHGKPLIVNIPVPREDCTKCPYNGTIVVPKKHQPLFISDIEHRTCAHSTYRQRRSLFDAGFTTYSKLFAILNTPAEESIEILEDIKKYDIIVFDEISQFVESSFLEIKMYAKHRQNDLTYSFIAVLNKQMNDFLQWVESGSTIEAIHKYVMMYIAAFRDISKFRDGEEILNPLSETERSSLRLDMIIYLNHLYNYALMSGNDVGTVFDALTLLCEEKWYISKTQTMEYMSNVTFVVPPKNTEILDWLKDYEGQIVITDATMPYRNMAEIFGEDLTTIEIGDPLNTAETQLIICDSQSVMPTRIFTEQGTERLRTFTQTIIQYHKDGFMVATSNSKTRDDFIKNIPHIPVDNITYQRSNKTIGVACDHRAMLTVSHPYAPKNAYDWMSMNLTGSRDISDKIWKINARNSYFQTIGRVKDPLAQTLSVVYAYGIKESEMEKLLKGAIGKPRVVEVPVLKNINDGHIIIADHWLRTGQALGTNEMKILILHKKGLNPQAIYEQTRLPIELITSVLKSLKQ